MSQGPIRRLITLIKKANYKRIRARRAPQRRAYQAMLAQEALQAESLLSRFKSEYLQLSSRPLISVIMPVYNAKKEWLIEAIESLQAQVYQEWELCIADDASTRPETKQLLSHFASTEPRVRVVYREKNGHISAASNSAIEIATGEYIALMDQDDVLAPQALLRISQAASDNASARLIYSDEDILWIDGQRESPSKKGPWQPNLLLSKNYVCHLAVFKRELIQEVGGLRVGYEGAQDHDLVLRCSQRLTPTEVAYIPEVLYHWRAHEGSTSMGDAAKPYVLAAREKAIQDHIHAMTRIGSERAKEDKTC